MAGNTFGRAFRLTTFGESHGYGLGGIIDGCPSGIIFDEDYIQKEVARRRPKPESGGTGRLEEDKVEFLSGIFEGKTTGAPVAFLVKNVEAMPRDYESLKDICRPSHADYTYRAKYGIHDYRGGGRASGRETISRVIGGAVAKLVLKKKGILINAWITRIGNVIFDGDYKGIDISEEIDGPISCPDPVTARKMNEEMEKARAEGETLGGIISCKISNMPAGAGEPVFDKLEADLAKAMMSIGTVKGFEIGLGFRSSGLKGSEYNDSFINDNGVITTESNNDGGVQGGISNGQEIYFNVAFKPVPTIMKEQKTVDKDGKPVILRASGRHDVCIVPRAVVIVEAMAALVLTDHLLQQTTQSW